MHCACRNATVQRPDSLRRRGSVSPPDGVGIRAAVNDSEASGFVPCDAAAFIAEKYPAPGRRPSFVHWVTAIRGIDGECVFLRAGPVFARCPHPLRHPLNEAALCSPRWAMGTPAVPAPGLSLAAPAAPLPCAPERGVAHGRLQHSERFQVLGRAAGDEAGAVAAAAERERQGPERRSGQPVEQVERQPGEPRAVGQQREAG